MKTKYSLKRHLSRKFFAYICILILCPLFVTFFVTLKNKPKDVEKISMFIIGEAQNDKIKTKIEETLPDLLEVKVSSYLETEPIITSLYDTEGATSDIVIMPKTFFETHTRFPYEDIKGSYLSSDDNFEFYDFEFGLKCNNAYFDDYINFNSKDYFAFFKKEDVHLNEITSGKTNYIKTLLEVFKRG